MVRYYFKQLPIAVVLICASSLLADQSDKQKERERLIERINKLHR